MPEQPILFEEDSADVWPYDKKAQKYYLRRFYKHQPDLNIANPRVREEIRRIMSFWLELGVSGFRLDAARHVIGVKGIEGEMEVESSFEYLQQFRDFLQWHKGDAILLAEANVTAEEMSAYFEHGIHMLFNFILNEHLFLALARQEAAPLREGMQKQVPPPKDGQWANFLRNHDELVLDGIRKDQRQDVFEAFAPEDRMRFFDRGIRRRLTPMFEGDERRVRMAYSLMFSLPGTPVLRYGQEIGMGEDLSLSERESVRTPMQWSDEKNGGFSEAPEEALTLPVIDEGPYSYHEVNVRDQRRNPESRLNWMERMIRRRREYREPGHGTWRILDTESASVFAHACEREGSTLIAVHNLADESYTVSIDLSAFPEGNLTDLHSDREYQPVEGHVQSVDLDEYGYRWFHLDH